MLISNGEFACVCMYMLAILYKNILPKETTENKIRKQLYHKGVFVYFAPLLAILTIPFILLIPTSRVEVYWKESGLQTTR